MGYICRPYFEVFILRLLLLSSIRHCLSTGEVFEEKKKAVPPLGFLKAELQQASHPKLIEHFTRNATECNLRDAGVEQSSKWFTRFVCLVKEDSPG